MPKAAPKIYLRDKDGNLELGGTRPPVFTGSGSQGNHPTPFSFFIELFRQLTDKSPREKLYRMAYAIANVNQSALLFKELFGQEFNPEESKEFDKQKSICDAEIKDMWAEILRVDKTLSTEEEIDDLIADIPSTSTKQDLLRNKLQELNSWKFHDLITSLENRYLVLRNSQKFSSFPRKGDSPNEPDEGSTIKGCLKDLREQNNNLEKNLENLITNNAEDDINKILTLISASVYETFQYKKLSPQQILYTTNMSETPRSKSQSNTRNNEERILFYVATQHLNSLFICFGKFNHPKISESIKKDFINNVANNWGFKEANHPSRIALTSNIERMQLPPSLEVMMMAGDRTTSSNPIDVRMAKLSAYAHNQTLENIDSMAPKTMLSSLKRDFSGSIKPGTAGIASSLLSTATKSPTASDDKLKKPQLS